MAHLGGLLRFAPSDIREYCLRPANLTSHPTCTHTLPFLSSTPAATYVLIPLLAGGTPSFGRRFRTCFGVRSIIPTSPSRRRYQLEDRRRTEGWQLISWLA